MAELEAGERGPRGRDRRAACARRRGTAQRGALGARPPRLGLGDEVGEGRVGCEAVAEPLQRAGRREHHAHRVPLARNGVAERVHARLRIGRKRRQRGEHDARCAHHDRERPGPVDPDTDRGRRAVARPGRDRNPLWHVVTSDRDARRSRATRARAAARRPASRARRARRPTRCVGDVEQQRAGGVGDVGRPLAGEPEPDVVLRQHDPRDPGVGVRLVTAQPQELRRREPGQRAVPGQRDQPVEADALLDLGALGAGALVVPEDRRADHAVRAVEGDEAVHLAGEPDPGNLARRRASARIAPSTTSRGAPPVLGILLRPAGLRRRERIAVLGDGGDPAVGRDGDALDAGRADIEPDDDLGSSHRPSLRDRAPLAASSTASSSPSARERSGSSCSIDSAPS